MSWWKRLLGTGESESTESIEERAQCTPSDELSPFRKSIEDIIRPDLAEAESKRLTAILENRTILEEQLAWEVEPENFTIYEAQYHGESRGFVFVPDGQLADYTARIKNVLDIDLLATEASELAKSDPKTIVRNGLFIFKIYSMDLMLEYPAWAENYYGAYFGQRGFMLMDDRVEWLRAALPIFAGADIVLIWDDKFVPS